MMEGPPSKDSVAETTVVEQFKESSRRVVRKIDMWLLPILFVTYNFNFMDKTILSSAAVFGLKDSTRLVGNDYSWVSSMFYFGYLFWEYPTTLLIQRLPVGKYVAVDILVWGAVVAATAACTNFGGLMTVRFLLGCVEATISPAFMYITSMWYTRDEMPLRTGVWFAGNSFGGFLASILAYGIGHIDHPLEPWQWMFLIFGIATGIWSFAVFFLLPDSIKTCHFLNEEEKQIAEDRVVIAGTGRAISENTKWKPEQVLECFLDPKTWLFASMSFVTQLPNSGTGNFGNLVLKGFGFTSLQTTLVGIPASFIAFFTILTTGFIAGRVSNCATYLLMIAAIPPLVGSSLIYSSSPSQGVKLFGYYLLSFGPACLPLSMSLVNANYKGITKKMTMTAFLFIVYCAGNIAGPQFFKDAEAPKYPTAFRAIIICYALVILTAIALRIYATVMNARRDRNEGNVTSAETIDVGKSPNVAEQLYENDDLTDLQTIGFRYRM